jgi:hypothetical protein
MGSRLPVLSGRDAARVFGKFGWQIAARPGVTSSW